MVRYNMTNVSILVRATFFFIQIWCTDNYMYARRRCAGGYKCAISLGEVQQK